MNPASRRQRIGFLIMQRNRQRRRANAEEPVEPEPEYPPATIYANLVANNGEFSDFVTRDFVFTNIESGVMPQLEAYYLGLLGMSMYAYWHVFSAPNIEYDENLPEAQGPTYLFLPKSETGPIQMTFAESVGGTDYLPRVLPNFLTEDGFELDPDPLMAVYYTDNGSELSLSISPP